MSKIHTTLHKKGDSSVDVYPNIESENIPSNAVTTDKIIDSAVTTAKIIDGAVTTGKIASNAVTTGKLASNSVTTAKIDTDAVTNAKIADGAVTQGKIADGAVNVNKLSLNSVKTDWIQEKAVTFNKLSDDLEKLVLQIQRTFNFYMADDAYDTCLLAGTFTASDTFMQYSMDQINHAFDFDRNQADYTEDDLIILSEFLKGVSFRYDSNEINAFADDKAFDVLKHNDDTYTIDYVLNGSDKFNMSIDTSTHTITSYTNTGYLYIYIAPLINQNI